MPPRPTRTRKSRTCRLHGSNGSSHLNPRAAKRWPSSGAPRTEWPAFGGVFCVTTTLYRPNVAAILQDAAGLILVCERINPPGAWQFPQGGVDEGETLTEALKREMREELSLEPAHYVVEERRGPYRYEFPAGFSKKRYGGQEQIYFRLRLTAPPDVVNVATAHPEFRAVRWIEPARFLLSWLPTMKHEVYRQVLRDFFGTSIV